MFMDVFEIDSIFKGFPVILLAGVVLIFGLVIEQQKEEIKDLKDGCPEYELVEENFYKKVK